MAQVCKTFSSCEMPPPRGPRAINRDRLRETYRIVMETVQFYNLNQTPDFETGNKIFLVALLKRHIEPSSEVQPQVQELKNNFNKLSVEQQNCCIQVLLRNELRSDIPTEDEFLMKCEKALDLFKDHDLIFIRG